MPIRNSIDQYGIGSKLLHWLIAAIMITLLALGIWMVELSYYDPWYNDSLSIHKALGISLGMLVILKLLWQIISPNPVPQTSLSAFEAYASRCVHRLLLLAMVALPVTGYLISSSEGAAIEVFNLFSVPALFQVSDSLRDRAISMHYYLAYLALAFIILHVAAALKHQFIDAKGTLKRML